MDTNLFSNAFAEPAGSPIRELFPYLSRPGMISFAGGYPSTSLFDMEGLREATVRALADRSTFQYGPTEGQRALREQLATLCSHRGIQAASDGVLVTTGSQQAFDLLVRTLVNPGDTVMVESPAYPATLQALRLAQARIVEVPTDAQGLNTEALEEALRHLAPAKRPKLLYLVPSFSNPGGTVLPVQRRQRLIEIACVYGMLVVEDDPYGDLDFTRQYRATLYQHGQQLAGQGNPVVYLSSLSKTVAPALRTGWLIGPPALLRRCTIAKQTIDLCTSPITQAIASAYLESNRYDASVDNACAEYRARMERMVQELGSRLGTQVGFVRPEGGMFLWVTLPGDTNMQAVFDQAVEQGVLYVPGKAFFADGQLRTSLRLSFAAPTVLEVSTGIQRLEAALLAASGSDNHLR